MIRRIGDTFSCLVEGDGVAEEGVDHIGIVVELLVDHEAKDTHLGSTAVVELDGELLVDGFLVPSRGPELSLLDFVLASSEATLNASNSEEGSEDSLDGKIGEGLKSSTNSGEVVSRGEGRRKAVASGGHKVAKDGQLGDAAVLDLHSAEALEALLVGTGKEAKRIPESKRSLGTDLVLEGHLEGGSSGSAGRRGEGSNCAQQRKAREQENKRTRGIHESTKLQITKVKYRSVTHTHH